MRLVPLQNIYVLVSDLSSSYGLDLPHGLEVPEERSPTTFALVALAPDRHLAQGDYDNDVVADDFMSYDININDLFSAVIF